ncbi:Fur family transcriptional regulator [Deferribacter thermophilus]|uniref:Fur family transcriptional regulator n=1 Tax=Deferribacter thermophilus TaxID=53573 RepID=UPI003C13BBE7
MQNLLELLKKNKLKATPQRIKILEILFSSGHVTIDDLYEKIKTYLPTLSLATVYSNLNAMIKAGIVKSVKLSNNKVLYECNLNDHIHLVCKKCNSIKDEFIDKKAVLGLIEKDVGVNACDMEINLYYVCPKCSEFE